MSLALILIGAFYVLAGVVASRQAMASLFLERMLASVNGQCPAIRETLQSLWLIVASFVVMGGGLFLLLLCDLAVPLFVVSAIGQGLYLFALAPYYFDRASPPSEVGRRQTTNAFFVYLGATAMVIVGANLAPFRPWSEVPIVLRYLCVGGGIGYGGFLFWTTCRAFRA